MIIWYNKHIIWERNCPSWLHILTFSFHVRSLTDLLSIISWKLVPPRYYQMLTSCFKRIFLSFAIFSQLCVRAGSISRRLISGKSFSGRLGTRILEYYVAMLERERVPLTVVLLLLLCHLSTPSTSSSGCQPGRQSSWLDLDKHDKSARTDFYIHCVKF